MQQKLETVLAYSVLYCAYCTLLTQGLVLENLYDSYSKCSVVILLIVDRRSRVFMGRLAVSMATRPPVQMMTGVTLHPCPSVRSSDRIVTGAEVQRKEQNNLEEWR